MHEIQRDPNFDQMVDKMAPKPTKERNSSKRKDRSNDDQQSRGKFYLVLKIIARHLWDSKVLYDITYIMMSNSFYQIWSFSL